MRYVQNKDEINIIADYLALAAEEALKSNCRKSQRGAVIVKGGKILGVGYNKATIEELCNPCIRENIHDNSRVELCCGNHAEQIAIMEALKSGQSLRGARLYHIKLKNRVPQPSGRPSCTICSRMICEVGVEVVLWHKEGYAVYDPREFNELAFAFFLSPEQK